MLKNKNICKDYTSKYFFMLLMFMWCSSTSPYLKIISMEVVWFSIVHLLLLLYLKKFNKKVYVKPFCLVLFLLGSWWILQCVKHQDVIGMDTMLISQTFAVFVAFNVYEGKEFFVFFEKVLVHLTILSLFVWGLGILFRSEMEMLFDLISIYDTSYLTYGHIGLVGLGNQQAIGMSIVRNVGFTWEAGRFSSVLVVGMFVNLLLHRGKSLSYRSNSSFWILAIGLITTFSTTGYGAALAVVLLYIYNQSKSSGILISLVVILLLPSLWSLSFFSDKILGELNTDKELWDIHYSFDHLGKTNFTAGRITGLYLEFQNLVHDFWLGYNLNKLSYSNSVIFKGNEIWLSNGILQILSKYGVFVGLFFYYIMFKSSKMIIKLFKMKGTILFSVLFVMINVSYNFWDTCLLLYFVYYWLFKYKYNFVYS